MRTQLVSLLLLGALPAPFARAQQVLSSLAVFPPKLNSSVDAADEWSAAARASQFVAEKNSSSASETHEHVSELGDDRDGHRGSATQNVAYFHSLDGWAPGENGGDHSRAPDYGHWKNPVLEFDHGFGEENPPRGCTPIPEPSTYALWLGLGAAGLLLVRRSPTKA